MLSSDLVFRALNDLFEDLIPVIRKYNGFIDKFIGYAILALFYTRADDVLKCAIEMDKAIQNFNEKRRSKNLEEIHVGIGINSGSLILGTIGSEERMDTTVIGETVNLASRLETLTKIYKVNILISEYTLNLIEDKDFFSFRKIDYLGIKGMNKPINIFEIYNSNYSSEKIKKKEVDFFFIKVWKITFMEILQRLWSIS